MDLELSLEDKVAELEEVFGILWTNDEKCQEALYWQQHKLESTNKKVEKQNVQIENLETDLYQLEKDLKLLPRKIKRLEEENELNEGKSAKMEQQLVSANLKINELEEKLRQAETPTYVEDELPHHYNEHAYGIDLRKATEQQLRGIASDKDKEVRSLKMFKKSFEIANRKLDKKIKILRATANQSMQRLPQETTTGNMPISLESIKTEVDDEIQKCQSPMSTKGFISLDFIKKELDGTMGEMSCPIQGNAAVTIQSVKQEFDGEIPGPSRLAPVNNPATMYTKGSISLDFIKKELDGTMGEMSCPIQGNAAVTIQSVKQEFDGEIPGPSRLAPVNNPATMVYIKQEVIEEIQETDD